MDWDISSVFMENSVFSILAAPWRSSMAVLKPEPAGDAPGPSWLVWLQQSLCGGIGSGRELKDVPALIKILLLSSQMSFEEFTADSLSSELEISFNGKTQAMSTTLSRNSFSFQY